MKMSKGVVRSVALSEGEHDAVVRFYYRHDAQAVGARVGSEVAVIDQMTLADQKTIAGELFLILRACLLHGVEPITVPEIVVPGSPTVVVSDEQLSALAEDLEEKFIRRDNGALRCVNRDGVHFVVFADFQPVGGS